MVQCNTKDKKNRSRAVTTLFESYKHMRNMKDRTERVYISERENNKHNGDCLIGHTKNYSKVILPYKEGLLGKQVIVKITECFVWHVVGDIVEENPGPVEVDPHYFDEVDLEYKRRKDEASNRQKAREEERAKKVDKLRKDAEQKRLEILAAASLANQNKVAGAAEKQKENTNHSLVSNQDDSGSRSMVFENQVTESKASIKDLRSKISSYYLVLAFGVGMIASGFALKAIGL